MHRLFISAARNARRPVALVMITAAVVLMSSCGFNVQTLQPYTPAVGVNVDVGSTSPVLVRNLLIVTDEGGRGVLSATLYANRPDALVSVSGTADALDGEGVPLRVVLPSPVGVPTDGFVILTDLPPIVLTGAGLQPGLTARLTLGFREAGEVTIRVPVMSTALESLDEVTEFENR